MIFAMFLLVVASQSFAVIIMCFAPSLRIGLSVGGLVGVLSLSIAGFSFPVPAMYLPFQAISYVLPVRHYFFDLCRSGIEWNTSLLFACTLCRIDFVCGGIHSVVTPG